MAVRWEPEMLDRWQVPDLGYRKEMGRTFGGMPRDSREEPSFGVSAVPEGRELKGLRGGVGVELV